MWDSGPAGTSMADTTEGNRSPDIIYAGSALQDSTTYYWRITFWDDDGASGSVSPLQQFTTTTLVNTAPTAPTTLYCNNTTAQSGQTNPTNITDSSPAFSAIYEDPDPGDTANKYRVEVNTQSDFGGTVMWDSGAAGTSMADTTEGNRSPDIIYAGSGLQNATTYYWRITFWDDGGAEGAVSATQQFTTTTVDTFSYRKQIIIDNAMVSGSSNLNNFPVMIKLTGADFQEIEDDTRPDGFDIIFRAEDATTCGGSAPCTLDYEFEVYDEANDLLIAWVRIPTLKVNEPTVIYLHYGNPSITQSQENAAGVWDSNYAAVWHLDEDAAGTGTADLYQDSTSNTNHGDDYVAATGKDGQVGAGQEFNVDYIAIPDPGGSWEFADGGLDAGTSDFTISGWFLRSAAAAYPTIVYKGGGGATDTGYWFHYNEAADSIDLRVSNGTVRFIANSNSGLGMTTFGQWHYVAVVFHRGTLDDTATFYLDGDPAGSESSIDIAGDSVSNTKNVALGSNSFIGNLDEVRISSTARSGDWIKTKYNNQKTPSSFISVDPEELVPAVALADHTAGQEADKFGTSGSVTGAELFAFQLTNNRGNTPTVVDQVVFQLSSVTGISDTDFANLEIYVDDNNDGTIDGSDTVGTVGGFGLVDAGVTTITFSADFTVAGSAAVNYILKGDVSNLGVGNTVTIGLGTSDVTLISGTVGGNAASSVTHRQDGWSYRKPIIIDSSRVVVGCPNELTDLTDFAVLISITGDDDLKTTANGGHVVHPDGYDITFRASDGITQLDHEVEQYDGSATGGTLVAWVRIPTLSGSSDTTIYLYYGDSSVTSPTENPTGVWDSNFAGVWHLKEDPSGAAPQMKDSTANLHHGTSGGTMTLADQVPGQMGGSLEFDGADDLVNLGNSSDFDVANITLTAWARLDSTFTDTFPKIASKGNPEAYQLLYNTINTAYTASIRVGGVEHEVGGDNVMDTLRFYAMTYDGATLEFFIDGVSQGTNTSPSGNLNTSSQDLVIANRVTDARHWKGIIDEVRISNTGRSTCWIQTEFNNQKYPNKAQYPTNGFITVDPEVSLNSAPSAPTTLYSDNDTAQSGRTNPTDITDTSPAFSAIYTDPDSEDTANKYRVEVNTQSDFAGTVMWDSGASGTSMADTTEGNRCPDIIYAGSALQDSTTYYWRIRFWDDDVAEGAVSATQQFTTTTLVNAAPTAPTTPYSNNGTAQSGQTNPTDITDTSPAFSAIYEDPDPGDIANKYRIEVNTQSDFAGTVMWDSGPSGTTMTDTTAGNRCPDIIYAGSALQDATTYYWRITFWDDDGLEGASATGQFTTTTLVNAAPTAPTTPYSNNDTAQSGQTNPTDITDPTPAFSAIYEDPDPEDIANKYRVEVNTQSNFSGTVMWDSGAAGTSMADTTRGNRSPDIIYAGSALQDSTTYYWRIRFWDDDGAEGAVSATQQFTTTTLVNSAPTAPTTPYSNNDTAQSGQTNPTDITDLTPAFSAIYNDPNPGDIANKYRVEVNTQSDFAGTVMWDVGASGNTMANTIAGNRCPDIIYAGAPLQDATTYSLQPLQLQRWWTFG
jgi:hypothetical protein